MNQTCSISSFYTYDFSLVLPIVISICESNNIIYIYDSDYFITNYFLNRFS